jgi:phospholipase/carboxylesterase
MSLHYEIAPSMTGEAGAGGTADNQGGASAAPPLIILLHGRGSNEKDLLGLRRYLPAHATVVCPRAPHPGDRWGYGPGWAWYRFLGNRSPDLESFEESQALLEQFLRALPGKLPGPVGPMVLGGFSQGGAMSLGYALRTGAAASDGDRVHIPHIVNLSGFLPELPTVHVAADTVENLRIFWGHGLSDRQISMDWAQVGRETLRGVGAELTAFDYEAAHTITKEELSDLVDWLPGAVGP